MDLEKQVQTALEDLADKNDQKDQLEEAMGEKTNAVSILNFPEKFDQNMTKKLTKNYQKIKLTKNMPKICQKFDQKIPKIDQRNIKNLTKN